jgi:hypothetical protein
MDVQVPQMLCRTLCRTLNAIFKITVFKEENCIEQVNAGIFYFQILKLVCELKFIFCLCLHFAHVTNLEIIYVILVQWELSCFHTFDVPLDFVQNPILWWSKHEGQFPTLVYLARAI